MQDSRMDFKAARTPVPMSTKGGETDFRVMSERTVKLSETVIRNISKAAEDRRTSEKREQTGK